MILIKASSPGWEKKFETEYELVDELRRHICGGCLKGGQEYTYETDWGETVTHTDALVDVTHNGVTYECRDLGTLLSTSCGCEYWVEED